VRKVDPRSQQKDVSDYRFHTHFQQDIYDTVIVDRRRIVSKAQWIDWRHLEEQQDLIYDQVIAACESNHLKILMGIHYDWNVEVIAQFYATLYIEEGGGARRMHWMTKGDWFNISHDDFVSRFSFGAANAHQSRRDIHNPLDEDEMKFMYALGQEGNAGTTNGLYTFYSVLNRLFRRTMCPKDGDPTNVSQFAKNLLANMRDGTPPLSVMDFVWEEIKGISMNPQKTCDFVPYVMFIIEDVTGRSFTKEGKHMPFRPNPTMKPLIPPVMSPCHEEQIRHPSSSQQQQNQSDWLVILVKPVGVNRGSLLDSSKKNLPPPSKDVWPSVWHVSLLACH
jgi:hypothetical protein